MSQPLTPTRGAVPSGNQPVPVLQRSVATQGEVSQPNFVDAFKALATTPTMLSEIGQNLTLQAGIKQAQLLGQYSGANPHGDSLPPLTTADKAYAEAYSNQSQVTLGLQAAKMMDKAQEELSQSYRLSSGQINDYTAQMGDGLSKIIAQAPSDIKPQLQNQLGHQLLNSSHQLQTQRITQDKAIASEQQTVWRSHQNDAMQDALRSGQTNLAKEIYQSIQSNISSGLATGMISPVQAETQNQTARLNYLTGQQIQGAIAARESGKLDAYLSDMATNKPKDVSWHEWDKVSTGTLSYVGQVENLQNRNQSLLVSDAGLKIQQGAFDESSAAFYKENLTPKNYNSVMSSYYSHQRKTSKSQYSAMQLAGNIGNADAFVGTNKDTKNAAFDLLMEQKEIQSKRLGQPFDRNEAEFQIAASSARPIPKFIEKITLNAESGSPAQIENAIQNYNRLHAMSGDKVQGVSDKALAMMEMYQAGLGSSKSPEEAALTARDVVFNKNQEVLELNKLKINEYFKSNAIKASGLTSWAIKTSGIDTHINLQDQAGFTASVQGMFKGAMQLTNGDENASQRMVQKSISKVYGPSAVNGVGQITKLPLEQMVGRTDSAPLIQQDVITQMQKQFDVAKQGFDKGGSQSYWRFKEGRPSLDDYLTAKKELSNRNVPYGTTIGEDKYSKIVAEFESGKPIEVEQVFKDKSVHTFNLNIQASAFVQRNPNGGDVIGDYDVMVTDKESGIPRNMIGYWGGLGTQPFYRPNVKAIQDNYILLHGSPLSFAEWKSREDEHLRQKLALIPFL